MATRQILIKYFSAKAAQAGLDASGDLVETSVDIGFVEMWNERFWTFRLRSYDLVITDQSNNYELPQNYAGVLSVNYIGSTYGHPIDVIDYQDFKEKYPIPQQTAELPSECAVYFDEADQKYFIMFNVVPANQTIPMQIYCTAPANPDVVPDQALGVLRLCIWKNMLPIDSQNFTFVDRLYQQRVRELEQKDGASGKALTEMKTEAPRKRVKAPWM